MHGQQNIKKKVLKLSTPFTFVVNFFLFIPTKCTSYAKYIYLSSITYNMLRRFLHHLQGDHCSGILEHISQWSPWRWRKKHRNV